MTRPSRLAGLSEVERLFRIYRGARGGERTRAWRRLRDARVRLLREGR